METRKANQNNFTKDTKTGQAEEMRTDNVFFEDYANMSDTEIAKLREKRRARASFSGKVLNTYVPEEYKNKNLHYEWVIYDPVVVDSKIKDGWVVVSNEALANLKGCSTTSEVKIPSGLSNNRGEPEYLILMAIHKVLFEEDMMAKRKRMHDFDVNINTGDAIVDDKGEQVKEKLTLKEVSIE